MIFLVCVLFRETLNLYFSSSFNYKYFTTNAWPPTCPPSCLPDRPPTHPHAHTHTCMHACTHKHTQTHTHFSYRISPSGYFIELYSNRTIIIPKMDHITMKWITCRLSLDCVILGLFNQYLLLHKLTLKKYQQIHFSILL